MARQKSAANALEIDRLATQLAKDPQSKAFLPLAEEYCKVGMWEEAVGVLEDGLKYYPAFITAMVVLGRAYDQLKQPTKAKAVLEGAVKLSPENLRAHRTLIKIYAAQGMTQEALNSCRVILSINPRDEEALSVQASMRIAAAERETPSIPAKKEQPSTDRQADSPPTAQVLPTSAPSVERQATGDSSGAAAAPLDPAPANIASRRTDIIAQLESWLRSLEKRRRDRPTAVADTDP
jgi:Tfp pilus assembly protein PilF